jgi:hypothetical protein
VLLKALWRERPDVLFAKVTFVGMDESLAQASDFAWPFFGQWMPEDPARRAAEFVARVGLSYLMSPEPGVDLRDECSVRQLVAKHVSAGVRALAA